MRVLFYGLNYAPEVTGVGKYSGEVGAWLAARGHHLEVVTAPPYYPAWRVGPSHRPQRLSTETGLGGERIHRCPIFVPTEPTGLKRLLHLVSFAVSSLLALIRLAGWQPDVVLVVEPTLFCVPLALWYGRMTGTPVWMHIQDFEVDAAFELGLLPAGGFLQRFAHWWQERLIRRCDRISSISPNMVEKVREKGVPAWRVRLFPNWVDIDAVRPELAPTRFRDQLGLHGKLVLLYSGNLGHKQGLEILAPLCSRLAGHHGLHLVICGDGPLRPHLETLAEGCSNLTMLPLQPLPLFNELLCTADIHLLPQRSGAADLVMPSKLTGILASGRPVVTTALQGTQVARVVSGDPALQREAAGLVVPPEDLDAMLAAILTLAADPDLRSRLGRAARRYAEDHLGKEAILHHFEKNLLDLAHSR